MDSTNLILLLFTIFSSLHCFSVSSFEYQVGGIKPWAVPPPNDTSFFNHWASQNRFQVHDTIRFVYKKDSVMEVSEEEYNKCNSSHPSFFSNTGNTVYKLNHSGPFYFISGVSGHCQKGQKMIIKVMEEDYASHNVGDPKKSAAFPSTILPKLSFLHVFVSYYVASYCVFY